MGNKFVPIKPIIHYYDSDCYPVSSEPPTEVDKNKAISDLSAQELRKLIDRLRNEREAEDIIRSLRRSSGEKDSYEKPLIVDTVTPVNQLYHHGIQGQKWGIRRYQKPDGTRTPAGKKRDAINEPAKSEDHIISRQDKNKAPEGLSNEQLRKLNERLQLEATYKNLTAEKIVQAESFVKTALKKAAGDALSSFAKDTMLGAAKLLVKQASPSFAEAAFKLKDKEKKE